MTVVDLSGPESSDWIKRVTCDGCGRRISRSDAVQSACASDPWLCRDMDGCRSRRLGARRSREDELPGLDFRDVRTPEERYRVYAVRYGEQPELLATAPTPASVGVAIVQLHEDEREHGRRLADLGRIGVLDGMRSEWVLLPWGGSR